jgi:cyclase
LELKPNLILISDYSKYISVPFTYGGGITDFNDAIDVLRSGADKISMNSILYKDINIIEKVAKHIGSQSIVASIDFKIIDGKYKCVSNAGKKIHNIDPIQFAKLCEDKGCGELLLNSIDLEGTMMGYDLKILEKIEAKVSVPIIISGGAGNYKHMYEAFKKKVKMIFSA